MLEAQKFQLAQHGRRRHNGRDGFPATKDDFTLQQPEDIAQVRAQLRARVDDEERLARVEVLKAMVEDGHIQWIASLERIRSLAHIGNADFLALSYRRGG